MSRNRYVGDYHLADSLDEKGRIRTEVEYVGSWYSFTGAPETVARAKKKALLLCIGGWIAYAAALIPLSAASRTLYTALPFALAAVPLALLTGTVLEILPQKGRFQHRIADRIGNRWPACAAFIVFLSALALMGEAVNLFRGLELRTGDIAFTAGAAALLAAGLLAHRTRRALRCEKQP